LRKTNAPQQVIEQTSICSTCIARSKLICPETVIVGASDMARNRIEELLSIKARAGKYRRVPSYVDLIDLRTFWDKSEKAASPVGELVPIRIVTLMEVFLRHWIQTLVDHGAPYVERAAKLNANIKYDFAIARSLQGGSISLGELIAHSVSLS
jgi:hypothetical protein